jgi:hypothetical protein
MGAYSSWPVMALTHHCIVRYCGVKKYGLLGDDIVIVGRKAAEEYQKVMNLLGLDISLSKSLLPSKDRTTSQAEIAKRLFLNGIEVSPLPSKLLEQAVKHPELVATTLKWIERSWNRDINRDPSKLLFAELRGLFKPKEFQAVFDLLT